MKNILFLSTLGIFFCFLYLYSVHINLSGFFGDIPNTHILENPKEDLASELYSSDGELIGKYYRFNRSYVKYDEISPYLIDALLSTEDCRFYNHYGIDFLGISRAILFTILLGKNKGGGSTLTQQLAKNLFKLRSEHHKGLLEKVPVLRSLIMKTKEWIVALKLERSYTKKEIITMYLNSCTFGYNSFGVKVASKTFFSKLPKDLNVQEAALLIGLLKAPTYYNPIKHSERAKNRRNVVLSQMLKNKKLSKDQYETYIKNPIELKINIEDHNEGYATYFRSAIKRFLISWSKNKGYDLFEDGLKIYTTIDSRMQKMAEKAVAIHMKNLQTSFDKHWKGSNPWIDQNGLEIKNFIKKSFKNSTCYKDIAKEYNNDQKEINNIINKKCKQIAFTWNGDTEIEMTPLELYAYNKKFLHAGMIAIDSESGAIKAWVGGINFKHFQFDHVQQGKRQPGSTFKPFVFAAAIDNGYMPWDKTIDAPVTFFSEETNRAWTPQNWNNVYSGEEMTYRRAFAKSLNSVTAYLTKQIGTEYIANYAKKLGISSKIDPMPAICLGSCDVSLIELVGAYSTFLNDGVWIEPHYIVRIEDKDGKVLEEFHPKKREAISSSTAILMLYMMRATIEEPGGLSSGIAKHLKDNNQIGSKTGTTQNQSDGWFIGLTKGLCVGVWVGGEDRCIHFRDISNGSGARTARPIWELFMTYVYENPEIEYKKGPLYSKPLPKELEKYKELIK